MSKRLPDAPLKFEVQIALGSAAMSDGRDVAAALRKVAAEIEDYHFPTPTMPGRIRDANGARRGYWAVSEIEEGDDPRA